MLYDAQYHCKASYIMSVLHTKYWRKVHKKLSMFLMDCSMVGLGIIWRVGYYYNLLVFSHLFLCIQLHFLTLLHMIAGPLIPQAVELQRTP